MKIYLLVVNLPATDFDKIDADIVCKDAYNGKPLISPDREYIERERASFELRGHYGKYKVVEVEV